MIDLGVLVLLALALSQWVKVKFTLDDREADWVRLILGGFFGGFYQIVLHRPVFWIDWLGLILVTIMMALATDGIYYLWKNGIRRG